MDAELFKPFKLCFFIFKRLGTWQDGNQSWIYFVLGYLVHFIAIIVFMNLQLIFAIKSTNLVGFTNSISLAITNLAVTFKWLNFLIKIHAILKAVETLKALLEFSAPKDKTKHRKLLRSQVQFGHKVFKVFLVTALFTSFSAFFPPILFHRLAFQVWFPFDTENSEVGFWSASIFMMFDSPFLSSLDAALDMLPVIFMTFAIGLIDELSERLENISKVNDDDTSSIEELKKCVEIHLQICEFTVDIKKNFSTVIMIQGLLSAGMLCTCAFTISTVYNFKNIFKFFNKFSFLDTG
jgi:7tm Odorant receptor